MQIRQTQCRKGSSVSHRVRKFPICIPQSQPLGFNSTSINLNLSLKVPTASHILKIKYGTDMASGIITKYGRA